MSAVSSDCTLNRVLLASPTILAHLAETGLKAKIGGIGKNIANGAIITYGGVLCLQQTIQKKN